MFANRMLERKVCGISRMSDAILTEKIVACVIKKNLFIT